MDTERFTGFLADVLGRADGVEMEISYDYDVPCDAEGREEFYSLDGKYTETYFKMRDGGARFVVRVTQLSGEDD